MENMPLVGKNLRGTPSTSSVYQAVKGDFSSPEARRKRKTRRLSSEGSLIHITGTGTILEESLDCRECYGGSSDSKDPGHDFEDLPPGVGQYDNFHTIDWQKDLARDRFRHRYILKKKKESFSGFLKGCHDAWSGWICVLLIGIAAGSVAGFIDIGEGWMKDLKEGVCPEAFWLNKEQCCWSSNETFYEGDQCDQWETWSELMDIEPSPTTIYVIAYISYIAWSLFFATLASTMVKTFAPYACGSGIPEIKTILSGFIMRGYLGKWTLLIKSVTVMLAVSAGLSLGKEGPLVHVVCCIGNILSYLFPKYGKNEAKKREILSAAAAAGVSVAFGAPIGGVLFSLEEVSYYFPMKTLWRSFFCALVAAFVLRSIDPFGTDHLVKYFMNVTRPWFLIELLPFVGLGILGGIVGTAFIRGNILWNRWKRSSKLGDYPIFEVLVVTLVTALVSFPNDFTRMNGSDLIKTLFSQCGLHDSSPLCDYKRNMTSTSRHMYIIGTGPGVYHSLYLLAVALVCKLVITIFTYGIKLPAGLFIPSMAMGAIMGRMVGVGMQQLALTYQGSWPFRTTCGLSEDCMAPGLYAMIGAASCLAGVTRMTVSLVVIMFELTGSVDYIVPLMATVVASKWVGDALDREGIYDAHIHLNKYPYLDNKTEFSNPSMAEDLTRSIRRTRGSLCCLFQDGMTLQETEQMLQKTSHNGFPVIVSKENPYLVGFVLRRDVSLALAHIKKNRDDISANAIVCFRRYCSESGPAESQINLNKIIDLAPTTVTVQTPMETVIDMFCKLGLRQTLVTNNGTLVDIITKKDILNYIQELKSPSNKGSAEDDEKTGS